MCIVLYCSIELHTVQCCPILHRQCTSKTMCCKYRLSMCSHPLSTRQVPSTLGAVVSMQYRNCTCAVSPILNGNWGVYKYCTHAVAQQMREQEQNSFLLNPVVGVSQKLVPCKDCVHTPLLSPPLPSHTHTHTHSHLHTHTQPEGITGSTRMKGGTATKMILDTIFSTVHCRLAQKNTRSGLGLIHI